METSFIWCKAFFLNYSLTNRNAILCLTLPWYKESKLFLVTSEKCRSKAFFVSGTKLSFAQLAAHKIKLEAKPGTRKTSPVAFSPAWSIKQLTLFYIFGQMVHNLCHAIYSIFAMQNIILTTMETWTYIKFTNVEKHKRDEGLRMVKNGEN